MNLVYFGLVHNASVMYKLFNPFVLLIFVCSSGHTLTFEIATNKSLIAAYKNTFHSWADQQLLRDTDRNIMCYYQQLYKGLYQRCIMKDGLLICIYCSNVSKIFGSTFFKKIEVTKFNYDFDHLLPDDHTFLSSFVGVNLLPYAVVGDDTVMCRTFERNTLDCQILDNYYLCVKCNAYNPPAESSDLLSSTIDAPLILGNSVPSLLPKGINVSSVYPALWSDHVELYDDRSRPIMSLTYRNKTILYRSQLTMANIHKYVPYHRRCFDFNIDSRNVTNHIMFFETLIASNEAFRSIIYQHIATFRQYKPTIPELQRHIVLLVQHLFSNNIRLRYFFNIIESFRRRDDKFLYKLVNAVHHGTTFFHHKSFRLDADYTHSADYVRDYCRIVMNIDLPLVNETLSRVARDLRIVSNLIDVGNTTLNFSRTIISYHLNSTSVGQLISEPNDGDDISVVIYLIMRYFDLFQTNHYTVPNNETYKNLDGQSLYNFMVYIFDSIISHDNVLIQFGNEIRIKLDTFRDKGYFANNFLPLRYYIKYLDKTRAITYFNFINSHLKLNPNCL